jgi:hypothetical protein
VPLHLPPVRAQPDPLDVTQANAAAAPVLYAQAQAQSIVALANANKAKLNAILATLRGAGVVVGP